MELHWHKQHRLKCARINETPIIKIFKENGFSSNDLVRLNRVRCFLKVFSLADITTGDGRQINTHCTQALPDPHHHSNLEWQKEHPTRGDKIYGKEPWNQSHTTISCSKPFYKSG